MTHDKNIENVKAFWDSNPLFTGESDFPAGSREFYEHHRSVYEADCFAGKIDPRIFPVGTNKERVLDLGCGPGFWVIELAENGAQQLTAADLTDNAIELTLKRAEIYGVEVACSQQNAENMTFEDSQFSHVNCQGVIHHTPDTEACIREISRVLEPNGTALISVYYKNFVLKSWSVLKYPAMLFAMLGAGMKGRGRETIYTISDTDEIVRLYDGAENPIGKAYSRSDFLKMLTPYFDVDELFLHFFPARSLPFRIPNCLHRFLDRKFGFMIFAKCRRKKNIQYVDSPDAQILSQ